VETGDTAFPVLYALMTRKTHALYRAVFAAVRDMVPDFAPAHVITDFEEASAGKNLVKIGQVNHEIICLK